MVIMRPEELIQAIDHDINLHVIRREDFDTERLVGSHWMDERYRPVVEDYVANVRDLFHLEGRKVSNDAKEIEGIVNSISIASAPWIGAGIGAVIGYLVDGPVTAREFAGGGAGIGFYLEMVVHPLEALAHKYINAKLDRCKEERELYRSETLSKLEHL
jgi:hypothetical protein